MSGALLHNLTMERTLSVTKCPLMTLKFPNRNLDSGDGRWFCHVSSHQYPQLRISQEQSFDVIKFKHMHRQTECKLKFGFLICWLGSLHSRAGESSLGTKLHGFVTPSKERFLWSTRMLQLPLPRARQLLTSEDVLLRNSKNTKRILSNDEHQTSTPHQWYLPVFATFREHLREPSTWYYSSAHVLPGQRISVHRSERYDLTDSIEPFVYSKSASSVNAV